MTTIDHNNSEGVELSKKENAFGDSMDQMIAIVTKYQ
jgi:hypothetical protein